MNDYAIAPAPADAETYVELTRSTTGKLYEKHILNYGTLLYPKAPGGKVEIDDAFVSTLQKNFEGKVCDIVQFPKADKNNHHSEDPADNLGEVVGLSVRDGKVFAQIDVRDPAYFDKMGTTVLGASAMFSLDYTDTRTGEKVGPTLLHVAATNRPYVVDLDEYKQVVAASADGINDAVVLTMAQPEENEMSLAELTATLKADFDIDLPALQAVAAEHEKSVALSNAVRAALSESDIVSLSADDEELTVDQVTEAISGLIESNVALTAQVSEMTEASARKDAEAKVKGYIREGRILPKQEEAQVTLLLTNPTLFESLLPEKPIVKVAKEAGTTSDVSLSNDEGDLTSESIEEMAIRLTSQETKGVQPFKRA